MKKITSLIIASVFALASWGQTDTTLNNSSPDTSTTSNNTSVGFSTIDTLIRDMLPASSDVGISVYDLTDHKILYTYQAHKLSRPASVMKLLTAITALSLTDGEQPFRTEVWMDGTIDQDTLKGNLYVVGGFDPEFDDRGMNSLVESIASLPFSVIQGKVFGDVSMSDSLYWGSGWAWDDAPAAYQPYMSPLMFCKDAVEIIASPSKTAGNAATLSYKPKSSFYTLSNKTQSNTASAGKFVFTRDWLTDGNHLVVYGNVVYGRKDWISIFDSPGFFLHTFIERLQAKGISVSSSYALVELPTSSDEVRTKRLAYWETPIQDVLNQLMKESDNLNAEALLYRLAAQSTGKKYVSADDGIAEIKKLIRTMGRDPGDYKLADGCGLSNYNYVSPDLLVDFLKYAYSDSSIYRRLYDALPVGGVEGTVKNRLKSRATIKNVHAKTGSFTAINSLAGYLKAANGHDIAFAILNQNILSARQARAFQDKVCETLAQ